MKMYFSTLQMLSLAALVAACSGSPVASPNSSGGNGQGGSTTGANGQLGGNTSTAIGGSPLGGAGQGGGQSGGAPTGGVSSAPTGTGGALATGGSFVGTGGKSTGGASANGGAPATGGMSTGGALPTGGASAGTGGKVTGGAPASGGASAGTGGKVTGGSPASGGASAGTGGKSTGGASAGVGGAGGSTPSSGCSLTSVTTGTTIDGTMTVGGQARTYRLSVPTDYVPGQALPVVFVFNGVGGTGPQAQQLFQLETGHRAIFIYPTALPNSQTPGQIAWDFNLTGVDVPYFDALVIFLEQNYCVDTSRIFALGASSGAIMSNMLGCFRGDVLRAIAPSSGMDWKQSGCKGDVAVMVICGTQDTFNPCDDTTNGAASETGVWVPQNGCTTTTAPSPISNICVAYQGCRGADPLLLCTHGGGHGWPTTNGDFWWQFFMSLG